MIRYFQFCCLIAAWYATSASSVSWSDERVTYIDQVRPVLSNRCMSCHNPDKLKGGLDLTSHRAAMAGGSGGAVLKPGDPSGSALMGVVAQEREPVMPPNSGRIPDEEIELIRRWIAGGCLETASSKPPAPPKIMIAPTAAPTPAEAVTERLTLRFPLARILVSERPGVVTGIDIHPQYSLAACAGQKQIVLFDLQRMTLAGILPFQSGFPETLRFSRSGRILIAGGGIGGKIGVVQMWSVSDGRSLGTVGEEMDAVLAADIDPADARIALGGPSRVAKIFAADDGRLLHRIEKHTDWITAIAYSPDGVLLASADRGGNVHVWEAESFAAYLALASHPAAVTSLAWRSDSNVLATSCEDGRVRWFEMNGGAMIKEWLAHEGGCASVRYARDGQLITTGRDRRVKQWDANGALVRASEPMNDVALTAVLDGTTHRIIAGDLSGLVRVWSAEDGALIGDLRSNPQTLESLIAEAQSTLGATMPVQSAAIASRQAADSEAAKAIALAASAPADLLAAEQALTSAEAAMQSAAAEVAKTSTAYNEAIANADGARQAVASASSTVEQAMVALKAAVEEDSATQAKLAESQSKQSALEATALEAERLAAEPNADAARVAAAQSARAAAAVASESVASSLEAATASSLRLKSAVEATDKAKAEYKTAIAAQQTSQTFAADAGAVLALAQGRKSTMVNQVQTATQARDQAKVRVIELAGASEAAQAALRKAREAEVAAGRNTAVAEAALAKWQAGLARAALDSEVEAQQKAAASFEPFALRSAASTAAAREAHAALESARTKLSNAPTSMAEVRTSLAAAEQRLVSASQKTQAALKVFEKRSATLLAFARSVQALKSASVPEETATSGASAEPPTTASPPIAASQPAATQPADSPTSLKMEGRLPDLDPALLDAVKKAHEALRALEASVSSAKASLDQAQAESNSAEAALAAARERTTAVEQEQKSLPSRIAQLETAASAADTAAQSDQSVAESARPPLDAANARRQAAQDEYERLLKAAAEVNTL